MILCSKRRNIHFRMVCKQCVHNILYSMCLCSSLNIVCCIYWSNNTYFIDHDIAWYECDILKMISLIWCNALWNSNIHFTDRKHFLVDLIVKYSFMHSILLLKWHLWFLAKQKLWFLSYTIYLNVTLLLQLYVLNTPNWFHEFHFEFYQFQIEYIIN